jgi:hypothetical protein
MVIMAHNHLEVQQAVAVEEALIQQAEAAEALVEQAKELGDKIKSILGECMQVMHLTHQHQMKVLHQVDLECVENLHLHNQQLVDRVAQDFMD